VVRVFASLVIPMAAERRFHEGRLAHFAPGKKSLLVAASWQRITVSARAFPAPPDRVGAYDPPPVI
jgi:hypothetical protein